MNERPENENSVSWVRPTVLTLGVLNLVLATLYTYFAIDAGNRVIQLSDNAEASWDSIFAPLAMYWAAFAATAFLTLAGLLLFRVRRTNIARIMVSGLAFLLVLLWDPTSGATFVFLLVVYANIGVPLIPAVRKFLDGDQEGVD